MLSESLLKIPATEYIERSVIEFLELEFGHPNLFRKRLDLTFKDGYDHLTKAFEFKFVKKDSTRAEEERQRIFNDLMRLYLFLSKDREGYFLICGNESDFKSSFENLIINPTLAHATKSTSISRPKGYGFYSEWFSFDRVSPIRTIDLLTSNPSYSQIELV